MSRMPTIKSAMRPFPFAVESHVELLEVRRLMAAESIRHLPVTAEGRLVGVVSARDLDRAAARCGSAAARALTAGEICSSPAYAVELDEPLDNVLLHMAEKRFGCALVVRGQRVVGIFTTTDACTLFAEHLRRDLPPRDDDAA